MFVLVVFRVRSVNLSSMTLFFATKADLLEISQNVEQVSQIKYLKQNSKETEDVRILSSLKDYENLGINSSGEKSAETFLVVEKAEPYYIREVQLNKGGMRYFLDQVLNPNSILLRPGGLYKDDFLICGEIGTMGNSIESKKIYNIFLKAIKQQSCANKEGLFVGQDAMKLYGKRRFIGISIKQPEEYDLLLD